MFVWNQNLHNLHGDVSKQDLELAKELLEMEEFFDGRPDLPKDIIAKMLVALAHDWFDIGDDDKGSALLEKASKVCPGYFDNEIKVHIEEDEMYAFLVNNLTSMILQVAKSVLSVE